MIRNERKWTYELIVEKIPPFKWLPRHFDVLAQLIIMAIVGTIINIIFRLSATVLFYGLLVIFVVILWSAIAIYYGPALRKLHPPINSIEKTTFEKYRQQMFDSKIILTIGLLIFGGGIFYFLTPNFGLNSFSGWLDGNLNPVLLIFVFILWWDAAYRAGLGLYTSSLTFFKSIQLYNAAKLRGPLEYMPMVNIRTFIKVSLANQLFGTVALLLLPIFKDDRLLLSVTIGYFILVIMLGTLAIGVVDAIPKLPPHVLKLLRNSDFAYVGTVVPFKFTHVTPVIYVFDGRSLYFATSKKSQKLKDLEKNTKIAFLVDHRDPNESYNNQALLIHGRGKVYNFIETLIQGIRMLRARHLFTKKYPRYMSAYKKKDKEVPLAWKTKPFISRKLVRVDPDRMVYWHGVKMIDISAAL
ncbi:pyridoxamine 5'-phosphate oxidase family protein [Candidatus Borrarchaeum sp.]|uniref:pyridoxamine 5'-phosphate oxidase family protein n=1 Tax=Candidatus Borrarchaeum sp. TaxID=2846742 RepID=UPI002579CA73|nr:pyridoxamine 5'-phosphate oxidase family protein [Candidatus Borrarchaeum sp.]